MIIHFLVISVNILNTNCIAILTSGRTRKRAIEQKQEEGEDSDTEFIEIRVGPYWCTFATCSQNTDQYC